MRSIAFYCALLVCAAQEETSVECIITWNGNVPQSVAFHVKSDLFECRDLIPTEDPHVVRTPVFDVIQCSIQIFNATIVTADIFYPDRFVEVTESSMGHVARVFTSPQNDSRRKLGWEYWDNCWADEQTQKKGLTLKLGVVADQGFFDANGGSEAKVKAHIMQMFTFASITFEKQMNMKLSIADLILPTNKEKAAGGTKRVVEKKPNSRGKCSGGIGSQNFGDLNAMFGNKYAAIAYLTDCHTDQFGGLASSIGDVCGSRRACITRNRDAKLRLRPGYESDNETGPNGVHKSDSKYVLTHELGHIFGGPHTFESSLYGPSSKMKGMGIMDYYTDGTWKGEVQFAPKHKKAMCRLFKKMRESPSMSECSLDGIQGATPATPPTPANPPTPSNPTPADPPTPSNPTPANPPTPSNPTPADPPTPSNPTPADPTDPTSSNPDNSTDKILPKLKSMWPLILVAPIAIVCAFALFVVSMKKAKANDSSILEESQMTLVAKQRRHRLGYKSRRRRRR